MDNCVLTMTRQGFQPVILDKFLTGDNTRLETQTLTGPRASSRQSPRGAGAMWQLAGNNVATSPSLAWSLNACCLRR
jgi:hypothetical protein